MIPLDAGARKLVDELREENTERIEVLLGPDPSQGGLFANPEDQEMDLWLLVNRVDYPYLDSHRIQDVHVVPMAMVLEWFLRAAYLRHPDLNIVACKDLQVLRGIRLDRFRDGGDSFKLLCTNSSEGNGSVLNLELPGLDNTSYYTARVEMAEQLQDPDQKPNGRLTDELESCSWKGSEIYNGKLFHGPDFHVIRSLEGFSDKGASAILKGTKEMGWPGELWKADVAALDGGLQLAILWGIHLFGKKSLPTKIGSYFNYRDGLVKGPIRCELEGLSVRSDRTVSDILFYDDQENLIAKMCGVEMHMLPDKGEKN